MTIQRVGLGVGGVVSGVGSFLFAPRTYEVTRDTVDMVVGRHAQFLSSKGIKPDAFMPRSRYVEDESGKRVPPDPVLAYPMASAKFHKEPMKWRYIACSAAYTLRPLSCWLGRVFDALVPDMDDMWVARMREGGERCRGSWVLRDSRRVPVMVRRMNNSIPIGERGGVPLQTFDFAKMYTNIRLDVLKRRMRRLFAQLFRFKCDSSRRARYLRVSVTKGKSEWVSQQKPDSEHVKTFSIRKLNAWFAYLVDNIYLTFTEDLVLRQRIGIPMGTNCAVYIANSFCYSYEYDFITQLVQAERTDLLRQFRYTLRFVDDLLSCNNPVFSQYLYTSTVDANGIKGIYPDFLRLSGEQDDTVRVAFLDTYVEFDGRCWFTKTYDKREHPPLSRVRALKYPHPSCYISKHAKYGIITSRLHCFGRICTRRSDFVARVRLFLREFGARGYHGVKIQRMVVKFLQRVPLAFPVRSHHAFARELMDQ